MNNGLNYKGPDRKPPRHDRFPNASRRNNRLCSSTISQNTETTSAQGTHITQRTVEILQTTFAEWWLLVFVN